MDLMMFFGSIPALVTPFLDEKPDMPAFKEFVEWQIASGSHGLVPCGTTGEAATLEPDEHKQVIETCVVQARGRVPVIAGSGSNATHRAVQLVEMAKDVGADAVLIAAPWYNKPSQQGIFEHFAEISKVGIPIIAYNVPGRTVVDISVATLARIAALDNVVGIKDATANIDRVKLQRQACGGDFVQLSGDDPSALQFHEQGGLGCVSVTANVLPKTCAAFQIALRENNMARAIELDTKLQAAHEAMFAYASPAPAKYLLAKMGLMKNELRLPMVRADEKSCLIIDQALNGLIEQENI
ncbi:MAG: 4-hydroxy-tetrahydrodipicolinate synthase [Robiginitomaculum sp.]|nr:4-hydroxy-tetrahydrodipicolinate synthase [Robiginitomaculum sp.]